METEPTRPDPPAPNPRRVARVMSALLFIGGPLLGVLALSALWVRSLQVEETFTLRRDDASFNAAAGAASTSNFQAEAETARGILGLTMSSARWSQSGMVPALVDQIEESRTELGWHFKRNKTRGYWGTSQPYRPFGRDLDDLGVFRTFHWENSYREQEMFMVGGMQVSRSYGLVAPFWVWMLPLALPPIWWAWCPAGRAVPRLTIRRVLVATAASALVLAGLAAFGRSSVMDRALMVLKDFDGKWSYGPNPNGSGRPVITGVTLGSSSRKAITGVEVSRLRAALSRFPNLRSLEIYTTKATGAEIIALIADHPNLENLDLAQTNADDVTLASLRGYRNLRELNLNDTKVTDAGLTHLENHPSLEILWLNDLDITDAGLAHLTGLPRFKKMLHQHSSSFLMSGRECPISDDALIRLGNSLPSLEFLKSDFRRVIKGK